MGIVDGLAGIFGGSKVAPLSPAELSRFDHLKQLVRDGARAWIAAGKALREIRDRQLYRFKDHGGRDVGLRFDLTVPLARFAAQHINDLGTPFKRYHIGTVWRGENTQRGRYREFMQCDFDTIGTSSIVSDIETALVINDLLRAIGFEQFTIHINNRQVLTGLLERLGLVDKSTDILRALDKLAKIGREKVAAEMVEAAGLTEAQAAEVLKLAELSGSNDEILSALEPLVAVGESLVERSAPAEREAAGGPSREARGMLARRDPLTAGFNTDQAHVPVVDERVDRAGRRRSGCASRQRRLGWAGGS